MNDETPTLGPNMRDAIRFISGIFDHEKLEIAKQVSPEFKKKAEEVNRMPIGTIYEIMQWRNSWIRLIAKVNTDPKFKT